MTIEDLIERDVQTIRPDETCTKAAAHMRDANVGSLIVTTVDDRPIGIVTDRDLVVRVLAPGHDGARPVREAMTREPIFLRERAPVREVIETMRDQRLRRVIVVDEEGRLCGVLCLDDLVMQLGDTLAGLAQALRSELSR
ncbi:MAG TPA: CBS domain-containing protein [Myxococcota bacterium]|nr:CBS domain-containing protein [Myxococcales bacterium]HPG27955.1 CBS domain-containing protein [Myxococcota bacterium]